MSTLREHLEAIRDWHSGDASELGGHTVREAEAALAILNAAEVFEMQGGPRNTGRLVPDPEPTT